jgi:hypothetical protein
MKKALRNLVALRNEVKFKYAEHDELTKVCDRTTSDIEYEQRKKVSELNRIAENEKIAVTKDIEAKKEVINLKGAQKELRDFDRNLYLKCVLASLGEPTASVYMYSKLEMTLEKIDTVTAKLVVYVEKNNKPKNAYDLLVNPELKSSRLKDYYSRANGLGHDGETFKKSFPCQMEAFAYFTKNRDKIIKPFLDAEKTLLEQTANIDFNPVKDFDCNLIDTHYSNRSIIERGDNYFIVEDTKWVNREMKKLTVKAVRDIDGTFSIQEVPAGQEEEAIKVVTECIKYNSPIFIEQPQVIATQSV